MNHATNSIVGLINFLTFLLSIPIVGAGIWLATRHSGDCLRFLQWPIIIIGAAIMLLSLAGFMGACFRVTSLMWLYLFFMFLLLLAYLVFIIFAFAVAGKGHGHSVPGTGFEEYKLNDFSTWLQDRVKSSGSWNNIRSCVRDAGVCRKLGQKSMYESSAGFYQEHLTPIQSGCCKPPTPCGYTYVNATYWTGTISYADSDCSKWSSDDQSQLCYDCDSCKAGVLANLKHDWHKVSVLNIVIFILLVVVYVIGCGAFRNNLRRDNDESQGEARMTKSQPSRLPFWEQLYFCVRSIPLLVFEGKIVFSFFSILAFGDSIQLSSCIFTSITGYFLCLPLACCTFSWFRV